MANEKRLIDANALLATMKEMYCDGCKNHNGVRCRACEFDSCMSDIEDAPTVDAVEVVHGRWERVIPTKSAAKWSTKVSCSACHKQGYTHHKFCPNCGADMRDGGNEDG